MKMTRAFLGFEYRSRLIASAEADDKKDGDGKGGDGDGADYKPDPKMAAWLDGKLNDTLKSHGSRLENRLTTTLTEKLGVSIKEAMAAHLPKADDKADDKDKVKGKDDKGMTEGERRLAAQLEEMKQKMSAKDQEAENAKKATRAREEREALQAALREKGVPEIRARAASSLLINDLGMVDRDEEDRVCLKVKKKVGGETFEEKVPVADAVTAWLATDDGKEFAPAAAAKGSGEKGGNPPKGKDGKPSLNDAYAAVGRGIRG